MIPTIQRTRVANLKVFTPAGLLFASSDGCRSEKEREWKVKLPDGRNYRIVGSVRTALDWMRRAAAHSYGGVLDTEEFYEMPDGSTKDMTKANL